MFGFYIDHLLVGLYSYKLYSDNKQQVLNALSNDWRTQFTQHAILFNIVLYFVMVSLLYIEMILYSLISQHSKVPVLVMCMIRCMIAVLRDSKPTPGHYFLIYYLYNQYRNLYMIAAIHTLSFELLLYRSLSDVQS